LEPPHPKSPDAAILLQEPAKAPEAHRERFAVDFILSQLDQAQGDRDDLLVDLVLHLRDEIGKPTLAGELEKMLGLTDWVDTFMKTYETAARD
jgi:hypothetical protein